MKKIEIRQLPMRFVLIIVGFFTLTAIDCREGVSFTEERTFPDGLRGDEIAKMSNERYAAHDESTELWMLLINNRGETRVRRFLRFRKDFPGYKCVIMKFINPEDIRDTGFLNIEKPKEKYDTQFLYLPAVKKTRRISAANKEQRWVGSDIFFEDIQETKFNDWNYKRFPDDTFDNCLCYVVEWTPKQDTDTVYGKQIRWYRKEGYLPSRIDYYDKKGKLWKRATVYDIRLNQGVWTGWLIGMEDLQEGHTTKMYRRWMFYDTQLPDDYFTTRTIEKNISSYNNPAGLWDVVNSPSEYDEKIKNP